MADRRRRAVNDARARKSLLQLHHLYSGLRGLITLVNALSFRFWVSVGVQFDSLRLVALVEQDQSFEVLATAPLDQLIQSRAPLAIFADESLIRDEHDALWTRLR